MLIVAEDRIDEYLGVGYLAAALRAANVECQIFQWQLDSHRAEVTGLLESSAAIPLLGITWLYDSSVGRVAEISAISKRLRPLTPVVVGGHPPSLNPAQCLLLAPDVNFVLRGEGDHSIRALVKVLEAPAPDLAAVPGLAYRANDAVHVTAPPSQIADLDALQWPARDTLRHVLDRGADPGSVVARMCTSRGCYARCEFCSMVSFYNLDGAGMKWRFRTPLDVASEMEHVAREYGVSRFWFVDDEFLGPPRDAGKRAIDIATAIVASGIQVEWGFDTRANGVVALSDDGLMTLRQAGLRVVAMGLESGSQAQLKRFNKGMKVESNWAAVRRLREFGIDHRFGFIMYDPETSFGDLLYNIDFARYAEPHRICNTGPFRLLNAEYPEVGTPFAAKLGVQRTSSEAQQERVKPKLPTSGLGYEFTDPRVGHLRNMLFRFARDVVEPSMIPRPLHESDLQADVWWQGTNYLPVNVAAMTAFLDVYEWAVRSYSRAWDDALPAMAESLFRERLHDARQALT
ncbi:MAG: Radical domain protein [Actinomycetia bacterium]|nr:Radical domain protein [Actinomycetes bacterium]